MDWEKGAQAPGASWEGSQVAAGKGNLQNSQTADSLAVAFQTSRTLEMVAGLVRMI